MKDCSVDSCQRKVHAKGLCSKHYQRFLKNGDPLLVKTVWEHSSTCSVQGCDAKYFCSGLCQKHYTRLRSTGDVNKTKIIIDPLSKNTKTTPEYRVWTGMKERCYNEKANGYSRYGGRGISVCERWIHSFSAFMLDMGTRPQGNYQIDRTNNDGNYEPANCTWVKPSHNARNRGNNKLTEEKVFFIRQEYASGGISMQAIADKYGAGLVTIYDAIKFKTWR